MQTKPLIGLFLLRDQSEALFTYGLVNFSMNFWTSQRSSERSSQHSRKSYMKSIVMSFWNVNISLRSRRYSRAFFLTTNKLQTFIFKLLFSNFYFQTFIFKLLFPNFYFQTFISKLLFSNFYFQTFIFKLLFSNFYFQTFISKLLFSNFYFQTWTGILLDKCISIGNYTVREVLMKNRTRVWRNIYNTASA
jgi:hypothetical protein